MKTYISRIGVTVAALATVLAIAFVPSAAAGTPNSVSSAEIVNHSINSIDVDTATNTLYSSTKPKAGEVGYAALDTALKSKVSKGELILDYTFDPTVVTKIGGPFASNATIVGTVSLAPGRVKIDLDGFWTTLEAGPAGTRPQLALRVVGSSKNYGTIFPGEASPAKSRELSGHSTKVVTLTQDTTIVVYAFGYNDDQSSAGGGRLAVTASVVVTAV